MNPKLEAELCGDAASSASDPATRLGHLRVALAGLALALSLAVSQGANGLTLTSLSRSGVLAWTNAPVPGVCTVETANTLAGPWTPGQNAFATNPAGSLALALPGSLRFHRLRAVDVPATPQGFTNLVYAYGLLETIAGNGIGGLDNVSYWAPSYEGGPAAAAALSRPHIAMADPAGNIYIADKNSHCILKVTPDGTIHTCAGTHLAGYNGEGPAPATSLQLNQPNGLWVRADGTVYILDTNNGRVRRLGTNGIMSTLFWTSSDASSLSVGRGLWVRDDESLAYFCAGTRLRRWTPAGRDTVRSDFTDLGTVYAEPGGDLIVCDRGANCVYRVRPDTSRAVLAGNGTASGGGDGFPALATGLSGVRSAWPVPTGGYLLVTHEGSQLWYLDTAGIVRLLLNGAGGTTHAGDGSFFYQPATPTMSEGRAVTLDCQGNILVCESDYGYIRRIRFQRLPAAN
jgi:hypothetical protein